MALLSDMLVSYPFQKVLIALRVFSIDIILAIVFLLYHIYIYIYT